jgi:1-deoxy-D-xylulose-5-phosphate synthase
MTIMSPKDENELQHMLYTAVELGSPVAVRYPRGNGTGVALDKELSALPIGKGEVLRRGEDVLFVCFGPVINNALVAADTLAREHGITSTVINARFAKPLDHELLRKELPLYKHIFTLEDHAIQGGFGSAVLEFASDEGLLTGSAITRLGVQDDFVTHGSQSEQQQMNGYDAASLVQVVVKRLTCGRMVA